MWLSIFGSVLGFALSLVGIKGIFTITVLPRPWCSLLWIKLMDFKQQSGKTWATMFGFHLVLLLARAWWGDLGGGGDNTSNIQVWTQYWVVCHKAECWMLVFLCSSRHSLVCRGGQVWDTSYLGCLFSMIFLLLRTSFINSGKYAPIGKCVYHQRDKCLKVLQGLSGPGGAWAFDELRRYQYNRPTWYGQYVKLICEVVVFGDLFASQFQNCFFAFQHLEVEHIFFRSHFCCCMEFTI